MIIYRYEKDDGGGPYCNLQGQLRTNKTVQFNDEFLYGCLSIEQLEDYFSYQRDIISDCKIKKYNIPDNEVIIGRRQVIFPKKYSPYFN